MDTRMNARTLALLLTFLMMACAAPALASEAPGLSTSPLTFAVDDIAQRGDALSFTITISAKDPAQYVLLGYDEAPDTVPSNEAMSYLEMAADGGKTMLRVGVPHITVDGAPGLGQSTLTIREDGLLRYRLQITGITATEDMDIDVRVTFESRLLFDALDVMLEDGTMQTQVTEGPLLRSALRFFSEANTRTPPPGEAADEPEIAGPEDLPGTNG